MIVRCIGGMRALGSNVITPRFSLPCRSISTFFESFPKGMHGAQVKADCCCNDPDEVDKVCIPRVESITADSSRRNPDHKDQLHKVKKIRSAWQRTTPCCAFPKLFPARAFR